MSHVWTIARKELRAYFGSAIALVFLGTFLALALFTFFWASGFFARGVADLRPLFSWMPLSLILLVASLSMRVWSEEKRAGTIEVLLTLPVSPWQLVLGKFVAGMLLIALALALTLGLPITVAMIGNLDWGPVIGGYLAALLLAAAYLSIGMCVSAATDNQILALIGTALVCGVLYFVGSELVVGGRTLTTAEILRGLGSGSRFESVARGVLDVRDLVYYGSLVVVFLGLNVLLLQRLRWGQGRRSRGARLQMQLAIALAAGNAIFLNLWLAPISRARIDLTEQGEYSLSETTEKLLASLDEPLLIRGYFSARTHPKLAPLVPRVMDLLAEYAAVGGKVRVEIVDPSKDEKAEKEAKEDYGIDSVPLPISTRTERSVVNAFFHIVVAYGDHFEVLGFDDLIEVDQSGEEVEVRLRNPEYDLTRTIKKVATEFQSVDALFASLPGKVELTVFSTPKTLPDNLKDAPAALDKVIEGLQKESGGKLDVKKIEPTTQDQMKQIFQTWGIRPYGSMLSGEVYYFHILIKLGDRAVRVTPPQEVSEAALKRSLTEALQRAAPGFTKVIALWTPPPLPPMPMMEGMPPQRMPPPQRFERLRQMLSATYEVRAAELSSGRVADDVDVVVLAGPAELDDKAARAIDQFVMRGGAVIALAGRYRLNLMAGKLAMEKVTTGLEDVFKAWGIEVKDTMVLDEASDAFPIPTERDLGGIIVQDVKKLPYPYFASIDHDRLSHGSVITAGVPGAVMHWVSPVQASDKEPGADAVARKVDVLARSSKASWLDAKTDVQPDLRAHPGTGFGRPTDLAADQQGEQPLAVAITGGFPSWAAAKDKPAPGATPPPASDKKEPLVEHSPPDARVVVFGSSTFVSDELLQVSDQVGSRQSAGNLQMIQNAVDWALADTELLSIRARSSAARALTVPESKRSTWEIINYIIALGGLGAVVLVTLVRRRSVRPITVTEVAS